MQVGNYLTFPVRTDHCAAATMLVRYYHNDCPVYASMEVVFGIITCLFMFMGSCGDPCGERVTSGELSALESGLAI